MNKPLKVLILGGAGYIGGYLVDLLQSTSRLWRPDVQTYDVTVYDNLLYEDRYLKDVKFIYGDLRDTAKLSTIINDYDVLVLLAAMVGDGACAAEPFIAKHINEISTNWIIDNYTRQGGKIIYTSTCSVYGKNDSLLDETSPTNPLSVYAETKLAAEQHLMANYPNALAFRLGTLYGVGDHQSRPRFDLVANVLALKAARGEPLSVFGGNQWRPLLHVRDVANAIEYGIRKDIRGLYNLSSGNYTIRHIAETIVAEVPTIEVAYTELSFEDQRNYKVSHQKILDTGWQPHYELRHGITQIFSLVHDRRIRNTSDPIYHCESYLKHKYGR